jgi:hypothetical protein
MPRGPAPKEGENRDRWVKARITQTLGADMEAALAGRTESDFLRDAIRNEIARGRA